MTITLWICAAVVALCGGGTWYVLHNHHEQQVGYQKCSQADTTVLQQQLADDQSKLLKYSQQLKDEQNAHATDLATLAAVRAEPVPHLVCRAAKAPDSLSVPSLPASASSQTGSPGLDTQSGGAGFDPGPALLAAADHADDELEACRDEHAQWVAWTTAH